MSEIDSTGKAPEHNYPVMPADLWSEILPGLWLGGTDDADTIEHAIPYMELETGQRIIHKDEFQTVVTMFAWANPADWLVEELRYGFFDANDVNHIDRDGLFRAAHFAHDAWKAGRKTLIRCQAGLNRSGLVMAVVLLMEGYTAADAINLMRTNRSMYVLCNHTFVAFAQALELEMKNTNDK